MGACSSWRIDLREVDEDEHAGGHGVLAMLHIVLKEKNSSAGEVLVERMPTVF
jgi:hypothetical protein